MKIKLLLILCLSFAARSSGQLNGTYTIGGISPDYATFSAAVSALVTTGVSGPVIFNVRNGTYHEKVIITDIPNSSSVNNITFQSEDQDSTVAILEDSSSTASANNFTLQLLGADWVTFKQLKIRRYGSNTYGTVVNIGNGSTNNKFLNNFIEGTVATTSTVNSSLFYSAAGATSNDSNMIIQNNYLLNGSYGVYLLGASTTVLEEGNRIEGNIFQSTYARAIHLGNQNSVKVINNKVNTATSYATFYSLYMTSCDNNVVVERNWFDCPAGGYGIYFTACEGAAGLPIIVVNNFVHVGGVAASYGIYITGSSDINFWNNSVHVASTAATSHCFYATGATTIKLVSQNNVFYNSGGGYTYYIVTSAQPGLSISNFNDLYSTGPNVAYWGAASTATLSDWQTATSKDANSVSADPIFASATDLHAFGSGINDAGVTVPSVTIDIDGELRSLTTPDIGADEFLPLSDNLAVVALTQPGALGACGSDSVLLEVSVSNLGSNSQSSIPIVIEITGALTQTILDTIPGPVALNSTLSHPIAQTISTLSGGEIFIKIYSSLTVDQFRDNDTIETKRTFYAIPNPPSAVSPQQGCNTSVGITATPDSGNAVFWYDAASGGNLIGIGETLTVPISSDTVFYAEAREGSGAGGCLRITEVQINDPDYVEIQNLSGATFDATGWTVVASNSYSDINSVNSISWNLGVFNAGEIQFRTDGTVNPWGNNLLFNPGSPGWYILLDPGNIVRDFIAIQWTDAQIQGMAPMVNGVPVTIGAEWSGNGLATCAANAHSRIGNSDNNSSADFACEANTMGTQNVNLSTSFANCGLGLCGSARVAVQVNMVMGVSTDLGPDTILSTPISYLLDAGAGFNSYLWNDGSTGQTLTATAPGIYWVTVTGANGCAFTDSMEISINVGMQVLSDNDRIRAYPNPVSEKLTIEFTGTDALARISDINGRIIHEETMEDMSGISTTTFDLSSVEEGLYFIQVLSKEEVLTLKLIVQHP